LQERLKRNCSASMMRTKKKAMLITGARLVGKTFIIREFGKQYESFVKINF
jgi:predicted AAA+ superfamily ATPase